MITGISIHNSRVLKQAEYHGLPRVMFICGPNGVGKTTLLDCMGRYVGVSKLPTTKIVVAPATRTWRREVVQTRMLFNSLSASDVLELSANINAHSNTFGRNIYTAVRDLWSDDESKQLVKPLLAKLKNSWQRYLADEITRSNYRTEGRIWPDPKSALGNFVHQIFDEIEYVDTREVGDNTNILFSAVNRAGQAHLDIDDLSSGEKAIFSVFLPVIEEDFRRSMGEPRRELTLVVDEVENHLHPSLQLKILNYMRTKCKEGYQFICTTHSTVLIKACSQEELFHVLPAGLSVGNQLRKASQDTYSLEEVLQESVLFANGFQRHIFCEGYDPIKLDENNICDSELYSIFLNTDNHYRIVASNSCDALMAGAKAAVTTLFAPLCLTTIRDFDTTNTASDESVWCDIVLPFYSLESMLLNADAILLVVSRYGIIKDQIESAISEAINRICSEEEISLISPGSFLRRSSSVQYDEAIGLLKNGQTDSVFQLQPTAFSKVEGNRNRLNAARSDRDLAIAFVKGKKIYRYVYESLGLRGKAFTARSFADQVARQARSMNLPFWINDLERIVKRGVGNSLSRLMLSDVGNVVSSNPHYSGSFAQARGMLEVVHFNSRDYAVIREGVKFEDFAQRLAPIYIATNALIPGYNWVK